jgi:CRISPR-associated protein Csm1
MYRDFIYNRNIQSGKYLSHAHYDIARNIYNQKDARNKKELDMLYDIFNVTTVDRSKLNFLNIPIFYAMNLNRNF